MKIAVFTHCTTE